MWVLRFGVWGLGFRVVLSGGVGEGVGLRVLGLGVCFWL